MNVEMFIRTLGYIVYVALWSPIVVLILLVTPFVYLVWFKRMGFTTKDAIRFYGEALMSNIRHDMQFIKTGVWY